MSFAQPPVQVGGATVLAAAAARAAARAAANSATQLPFTGALMLQQVAASGAGLVAVGALLLRRGRGTTVAAGHAFD